MFNPDCDATLADRTRIVAAEAQRWSPTSNLANGRDFRYKRRSRTRAAYAQQIELSFRTTGMVFGLLLFTSSLHVTEQPKEILLCPKGAPGSEGKTGETKVRHRRARERVLSNIRKPSLTPYLPPADKATGCAVVVAPGGGHRERLKVPTKTGPGNVITYKGAKRFSRGRWQCGNVHKVLNSRTTQDWLRLKLAA